MKTYLLLAVLLALAVPALHADLIIDEPMPVEEYEMEVIWRIDNLDQYPEVGWYYVTREAYEARIVPVSGDGPWTFRDGNSHYLFGKGSSRPAENWTSSTPIGMRRFSEDDRDALNLIYHIDSMSGGVIHLRLVAQQVVRNLWEEEERRGDEEEAEENHLVPVSAPGDGGQPWWMLLLPTVAGAALFLLYFLRRKRTQHALVPA